MLMDAESKMKKVLVSALHYGASDIHFIPGDSAGVIRFRVDGMLTVMESFSDQLMKRLISYLKFISGMDIGERRRPQNSRLEMSIHNRLITMRLSTFPSSEAESLVIRLFPQERELSLNSLSLFPAQTLKLEQMINRPSGLIIVCGPTGAGKTTTLYSLINRRQDFRHENVITLEDPVEWRDKRYLQMEINEKAGITYSAGIKSLLRHDPDLIMLGEIRDKDTARMAVRASLTGRLVLTTLHSSSAAGAVKRLLDLDVKPSDLSEVLEGVINQRLVSVVCPMCNGPCDLHCRKSRSVRRMALFEIAGRRELAKIFSSQTEEKSEVFQANAFNRVVRKAYALGYLSSEDFLMLIEGDTNEKNIPQ